jgi:hypothetical protein
MKVSYGVDREYLVLLQVSHMPRMNILMSKNYAICILFIPHNKQSLKLNNE